MTSVISSSLRLYFRSIGLEMLQSENHFLGVLFCILSTVCSKGILIYYLSFSTYFPLNTVGALMCESRESIEDRRIFKSHKNLN